MNKVYFPELAAEMARRGENQGFIAKLLDLPQAGVSGRLNGKIEFSKSEIDKICDHYKKSYEELFKQG